MKIEERKNSNMVMIQELKSGDVFLYSDDYYILTDIDFGDGYLVGINLENGEEENFNKKKTVLRVNGTFVIK